MTKIYYAMIDGRPIPLAQIQMHRVLIRITGVGKSSLTVVVPSWRPDEELFLSMISGVDLDVETLTNLKEGDCLMGDVNIGALHAHDVVFNNVNELLPEMKDA